MTSTTALSDVEQKSLSEIPHP
ncbi:MAG: hypothetical protein QOF38_1947, partial [Pseudonocardiales bacterium]|nr:hypothetical protein [Pseudonocardiales bacterium]